MATQRPSPGISFRFLRLPIPLLVLVISLLLTVAATYYVSITVRERDRLRFENNVQRTETSIRSRLNTYIAMLRAGRAHLEASGLFNRESFQKFAGRLELPQLYPGIQGIGFAAHVLPQERDSLVAEMRSQGVDSFRIWPEGARDEYVPILYLEPLDRRNRQALGYDMFTESVRRDAMTRARDRGEPAATGRLTLVGEIDDLKQAGFIIYYPIYRGDTVPADRLMRIRDLRGFIYAPFRADDLLEGVFGEGASPLFDIRVYDGSQVSSERILHHSNPADTLEERQEEPTHISERHFDVAGRPWTVVIATRQTFDAASSRPLVPLIFIGGLVFSLLLYYLSRSQSKARMAAEKNAADLRRSQDRLRTIVETAPDVIYTISRDATVTSLSPAFEAITGWTVDEWIGEPFAGIIHPDDLELALGIFMRMLAGETAEPYELRVLGRSGSYIIGEFRSRPQGERGEVTGVIGIARDITGRKRTEQDLRAARDVAESASRAKDQFLAVLSHELRTPLTPVLSAIQLLESDPDLTREAHELVELIHRNVELEARLIDDLLDLTRIANGKLELHTEMLDAHQVLRNSIEISHGDILEKGMTLRVALDADRCHVRGDSARMHQVFWNVIKNAVKFTPSGGWIEVATRNVDDKLVIEIQDSGIGIEPEMLSRVFNAFEQGEQSTTRRFGGLGLGLSISKMLVELHGGSISVASAGRDSGATFTIELAAEVPPEGGGQSVPAPASEEGTRALDILLVEDHEDTREMYRALLEKQGFRVGVAEDVKGALELASSNDFALLISDIGLPDGTGHDLVREIRRRRPIRAIALSGFGMEEDVRRSLDAGFLLHLIKPVSSQRLAEAIEEVLRRWK